MQNQGQPGGNYEGGDKEDYEGGGAPAGYNQAYRDSVNPNDINVNLPPNMSNVSGHP